jgi:hypothetical protein
VTLTISVSRDQQQQQQLKALRLDTDLKLTNLGSIMSSTTPKLAFSHHNPVTMSELAIAPVVVSLRTRMLTKGRRRPQEAGATFQSSCPSLMTSRPRMEMQTKQARRRRGARCDPCARVAQDRYLDTCSGSSF